jgi:hypothetical protein
MGEQCVPLKGDASPADTATKGAQSTRRERHQIEPFPDLATLNDSDLRALIRTLQREEHAVSYRRRILHGWIDVFREELVARLQKTEGRSVLDRPWGDDPESSGVREPRRPTKPSLDGAAFADLEVDDER